jgi:hypothetical protein
MSLRDPIKRIIFLYWYKHVQWWYGDGEISSECETFKVWLDAWKDNSPWKKGISNTDLITTYVEVENYFVKSLIGRNASSPRTCSLDLMSFFSAIYYRTLRSSSIYWLFSLDLVLQEQHISTTSLPQLKRSVVLAFSQIQ